MWLKILEETLHNKRLSKEDVAVIGEMSRTGFYDAMKKGSLRFDVVMRILKHYDIDYYDIVKEEYSTIGGTNGKYENPNKANNDITKLLEQLRLNYEDKINLANEHNETLKSQIAFLQQIISKNIGLGETTSRAM